MKSEGSASISADAFLDQPKFWGEMGERKIKRERYEIDVI
jgi:hypothetical protein